MTNKHQQLANLIAARLVLAYKTTNEEYGFWGTTHQNISNGRFLHTIIDEYYDMAVDVVAAKLKITPQQACKFLDSKAGRWIADSIHRVFESSTKVTPAVFKKELENNRDLTRMASKPAEVKKYYE